MDKYGWRPGRYNFATRLIVRRRLGIDTENYEELFEPPAVDEFIALTQATTIDLERWS